MNTSPGLETLEKKLTQKGNIEEALAVRGEKAAIAARLQEKVKIAALDPSSPKTEANSTGTPSSVVASAIAPAGTNTPELFPGIPSPTLPAATPAPPVAAVKSNRVPREKPAQTQVEGLTPLKLDAGEREITKQFAVIPPELVGATIFVMRPWVTDVARGRAVYKTISPGRVYVACNFENQGGEGLWTSERWSEKSFTSRSWTKVEDVQLVGTNKRKFVLFTKMLDKDVQESLRCNKYEPPYFITFTP